MKRLTRFYSALGSVLGSALVTLAVTTGAPTAAFASDTGLKNASVAGTLGTWAYALMAGAQLFNCEPQGIALRASTGKDDELKSTTIGLAKGECSLKKGDTWALSYLPMLLVTDWRGDSDSVYKRSAIDVAFVPMLRWKTIGLTPALELDLELGIGPAWLSETKIGDREKSTKFQFSDHLGFGIGDPKGQWRLGLAYRHVSNGDIKSPNRAVDFKGVSFEWKLP